MNLTALSLFVAIALSLIGGGLADPDVGYDSPAVNMYGFLMMCIGIAWLVVLGIMALVKYT